MISFSGAAEIWRAQRPGLGSLRANCANDVRVRVSAEYWKLVGNNTVEYE